MIIDNASFFFHPLDYLDPTSLFVWIPPDSASKMSLSAIFFQPCPTECQYLCVFCISVQSKLFSKLPGVAVEKYMEWTEAVSRFCDCFQLLSTGISKSGFETNSGWLCGFGVKVCERNMFFVDRGWSFRFKEFAFPLQMERNPLHVSPLTRGTK